MGMPRVGWWQATVRWLLELDKPVPDHTEEELEKEAAANYNWNFLWNVGDGVFFWFGLSFISATTILPLFVSKLSSNEFWIALLGVLSAASWYLPQLLTAGGTERLARKKPVVINVGFILERLPLWFLPLAALAAPYSPTLALIIFFVAYAWHGLGAGAIAPAWSDMIARCFPVSKRAWFFGFTAFIGTGIGILGAAFSSWMLVNYTFPYNFVYSFALAALAITISWASLAMTREPIKQPAATAPRGSGASRQKIKAIVRGDHNFRNFLVARFLINVGRMGAGFLTVAAIFYWDVSDATVGWYTAALFLGQTIGNLAAGVIADRRGHKLTLAIGQAMAIIGFGMAWLAPSAEWYYPIFFFLGLAAGITTVSAVLSSMEFSHRDHLPTYVGVGNTVSGLGSAVAPIIGGLLAVLNYDLLFAVSTLISILALLMLIFTVREPRRLQSLFNLDAPTQALAEVTPESTAAKYPS
jgi:MFS family permease